MARRLRIAVGGIAYHVLNRAAGKKKMFHKPHDYQAFENILAKAHERLPVRVLSYCFMPSHWHLVLWPESDGELSEFVRWLTLTHAQRHHAHYGETGTGPLYQGRFKSFPIQDDPHLLVVCRYVERNALRAGLVRKADDWAWSSFSARTAPASCPWLLPTAKWPVPFPRDWKKWVNEPQTAAEVEALRLSVRRGRPFGDEPWQQQTARQLRLESTFRPVHRPNKNS